MGEFSAATVMLVPMPADHLDEFAALAIASHAADSVASGRWPELEAPSLAEQEFWRLLPERAATPDHHFYEIRSDPAGPVLGFVWLGIVPRRAERVVFVFQLFVHPPHRRQGHARAALARVEELAGSWGMSGVALNVLGANSGAQTLYRSCGYAVTSLSMHKPLPTGRAA